MPHSSHWLRVHSAVCRGSFVSVSWPRPLKNSLSALCVRLAVHGYRQTASHEYLHRRDIFTQTLHSVRKNGKKTWRCCEFPTVHTERQWNGSVMLRASAFSWWTVRITELFMIFLNDSLNRSGSFESHESVLAEIRNCAGNESTPDPTTKPVNSFNFLLGDTTPWPSSWLDSVKSASTVLVPRFPALKEAFKQQDLAHSCNLKEVYLQGRSM